MRYLALKPQFETKEEFGGASVTINYKDIFKAVLVANASLDEDQLIRASYLFSKIKDANEGDVIEIEDQDYPVILTKLKAFTKTLTGQAVACEAMSEFVKYIKDLPTKKLELVK